MTKDNFRQIPLYAVLTQEIRKNFMLQLLISHAFREVHSMLASKFLTALKSYLNTHLFYSSDEFPVFENDW